MQEPASAISIRYTVQPSREAWELPEGPVPESTTHDRAVDHIKHTLEEWVLRTGRAARVVRNLAVKWDRRWPGRGVDPDVCLLEPPPVEEHLASLRAWEAGHVVPRLCFEVVSESHPYKDYREIQERYAAMGTRELIVFDPLKAGPVALGGPVLLQVWRRTDPGTFERLYFGDGPAHSAELGAWLRADGERLRFSDDRDGSRPWLTSLERERAEKERERTEKERERTEKERERAEKERERALREAAELRLTELERRLAERG
jgi:Uma2 family endonuclease